MIKSMTGYGKAEALIETGKITVEVRSLNGKTADISLKTSMLPKDKEMTVRQKIAAALTRGNIDFFITYEPNAADSAKKINMDLAMEYYSQLQILGEKKTLQKIDSDVMKEYNTLHFTPSNMAFTIVSSHNGKRVAAMVKKSVEKYWGKEVEIEIVNEGAPGGKTGEAKDSYTLDESEVFHKSVARKSHQAHCIVGAKAYNLYDSRRIALSILVNILGGPASGSRLNMSLREKHGLVYNVEAVYTPYADTGIFSIYFGCDKEDVEQCLSLIKKELCKF